MNGNFSWQSGATTTPNLFGFIDTNHATGYNASMNYAYHFTARLISNLRYNFSRQAVDITPYFANVRNVSGLATSPRNPGARPVYRLRVVSPV